MPRGGGGATGGNHAAGGLTTSSPAIAGTAVPTLEAQTDQPAAGGNAAAVTTGLETRTAGDEPSVRMAPLVGSVVCFTVAGVGLVWLRRRPVDDPDLS